jgi:hypothetical protein
VRHVTCDCTCPPAVLTVWHTRRHRWRSSVPSHMRHASCIERRSAHQLHHAGSISAILSTTAMRPCQRLSRWWQSLHRFTSAAPASGDRESAMPLCRPPACSTTSNPAEMKLRTSCPSSGPKESPIDHPYSVATQCTLTHLAQHQPARRHRLPTPYRRPLHIQMPYWK